MARGPFACSGSFDAEVPRTRIPIAPAIRRILNAWSGFAYGSGFGSPPSVSATWMPNSGTLISVVKSDNSVHYFEFDGWRTIE